MSAVTFTGGSLEDDYGVKPAESSSDVSVLVAVAYEVDQRVLKIDKNRRHPCWLFIVRGLDKRVPIATERQ